jgi:O-antigen/teichoic acid export membrane protein
LLKGFLKDLGSYLPARLLPALTAIITTPILTRLFLPAEFGYWVLVSGVTGFLIALAGSGFGSAAIRFFPIYKARSELGVFFASLSVSVVTVISFVSAISFASLYLLRDHIPSTMYTLLLISILIFVIEAVYALFTTVMRAQERSGSYTTFHLLLYYGSLGIGLVLVVIFNLGVKGMLWGTFLALVLTLPFLLHSATKGIEIRPHHIRISDANQLFRYAWPLALGNVAHWAQRLLDRYIISFFRSPNEVGLYSVAYNISGKSIDMMVALFLLSVSPLLVNKWESEGQETTERAMTMVTRLYLLLGLPAVVGLTVLALPFVTLLTSEAYHEGYRIVGYVALASFAWGLSQIAIMGISIKKKARRMGINQIIATLTNLALNLVLIPQFGFIAAGINSAISFGVLIILHAYASRVYLSWYFPYRTLRNGVIASMCMGMVVWGVYGSSGSMSKANLGYLLLSIVLAAIVYFGSLLMLGEITSEERFEVKRLIQKLATRTSISN